MSKPHITSYSGKEYTIKWPGHPTETYDVDEHSEPLITELIGHLTDSADNETSHSSKYDVHRVAHDLDNNVEKGKGYEYMQIVSEWSKKFPKEVIECRVDDECFAGSSIFLIPHRSKYKHMGVSVLYIPQCTGEDPIEFFCYPHHLDGLIEGLRKMRSHLMEVPENDTSSPRYRRGLKIHKQLIALAVYYRRFKRSPTKEIAQLLMKRSTKGE